MVYRLIIYLLLKQVHAPLLMTSRNCPTKYCYGVVQEFYEHSAEYEWKHDPKKLEELGSTLTSLDAGASIVVTKAFANMLNLANLAEEVQIAYRRRSKFKKRDFSDKASALTELDIEIN